MSRRSANHADMAVTTSRTEHACQHAIIRHKIVAIKGNVTPFNDFTFYFSYDKKLKSSPWNARKVQKGLEYGFFVYKVFGSWAFIMTTSG